MMMMKELTKDEFNEFLKSLPLEDQKKYERKKVISQAFIIDAFERLIQLPENFTHKIYDEIFPDDSKSMRQGILKRLRACNLVTHTRGYKKNPAIYTILEVAGGTEEILRRLINYTPKPTGDIIIEVEDKGLKSIKRPPEYFPSPAKKVPNKDNEEEEEVIEEKPKKKKAKLPPLDIEEGFDESDRYFIGVSRAFKATRDNIFPTMKPMDFMIMIAKKAIKLPDEELLNCCSEGGDKRKC